MIVFSVTNDVLMCTRAGLLDPELQGHHFSHSSGAITGVSITLKDHYLTFSSWELRFSWAGTHSVVLDS